LNTSNPETKYLREEGREDPWLFCEVERAPQVKLLGNPASDT